HRWLARDGEPRATARALTGACNAAFLALALTGLYLWWPRQSTWKHVCAVMRFRRGLKGKARDFNWHNVIGFWCAPVLVVLTASGMVISYTWASNLVYTLTGSPRPTASREQAREVGPANGATRGAPSTGAAAAGTDRPSLETLVARAERQLPTWQTLIIRLPARAGGPITFSMSDREHWNSFARSTLTLDGTTGAEVRWEPYAHASLGQKLRGWLRFAHTGELGGIPGEAIAGAASAGGAFLVWTGIALALRRFAAWRARRAAALRTETPAARVA
ncbi:MAG TPA: PepSY-associated TM helix domain-containing protein, partial [Vicinamibacterales bacterium]|nr:PepSY-associated TM helix domain-containing protein [Vicinamibacterales bacterium]